MSNILSSIMPTRVGAMRRVVSLRLAETTTLSRVLVIRPVLSVSYVSAVSSVNARTGVADSMVHVAKMPVKTGAEERVMREMDSCIGV